MGRGEWGERPPSPLPPPPPPLPTPVSPPPVPTHLEGGPLTAEGQGSMHTRVGRSRSVTKQMRPTPEPGRYGDGDSRHIYWPDTTPGAGARMLELQDRLSVALNGQYDVVRELGRGGMATVY